LARRLIRAGAFALSGFFFVFARGVADRRLAELRRIFFAAARFAGFLRAFWAFFGALARARAAFFAGRLTAFFDVFLRVLAAFRAGFLAMVRTSCVVDLRTVTIR
jgi:hypothetical protein